MGSGQVPILHFIHHYVLYRCVGLSGVSYT